MNVNKAVIPAAGFGTRFLPVTKAQPKEMMPLLDKPTIQYVVEEAIASGISDVLIVTGRGKESIQRHFDKSYELEAELQAAGKLEYLERIQAIADLADIHYVRQKERNGLGDAVLCAQKHVGNEPFALLLGDTVVAGGPPCTDQLMTYAAEYGEPMVSLERVQPDEVSSYGIAEVEQAAMKGPCFPVKDFVEKPTREAAPSNLAITGRYVLPPAIFDILEDTDPGVGNELQITDAIRTLPSVRGVELQGTRYDIGNIPSWLQANVDMAIKHDGEMSDAVLQLVRTADPQLKNPSISE